MLNLKKRSNITFEEKFWVCSTIQAALLNALSDITGWSGADSDAIFHGGTSLRFAHGSFRFSEDLDFMVGASQIDCLEELAEHVSRAASAEITGVIPDSVLTFRTRGENPGKDRMDTWEMKWSHPMRMGVAKVKCEFYAVHPGLLASYAKGHSNAIRLGGIRCTSAIPVGSLVSLWGDKIKASATRNQFKMRDAHDIGYLSAIFERTGRPEDQDLLQAISISASFYDKTLEDVLQGLSDRLSSGLMLRETDFLKDMRTWFTAKNYEALMADGTLHDYWLKTGQELDFAMRLIQTQTPATQPGKVP